MPVSDTQPVSVEDLKLLAGRLGREVLYAGEMRVLSMYIYDDGSITDLELTVDTSINTDPIKVVTIPFTEGTHTVTIVGSRQLVATIAQKGSTTKSLMLNVEANRVVGIRSGGGV